MDGPDPRPPAAGADLVAADTRALVLLRANRFVRSLLTGTARPPAPTAAPRTRDTGTLTTTRRAEHTLSLSLFHSVY